MPLPDSSTAHLIWLPAFILWPIRALLSTQVQPQRDRRCIDYSRTSNEYLWQRQCSEVRLASDIRLVEEI
jgi:hypothetical protein